MHMCVYLPEVPAFKLLDGFMYFDRNMCSVQNTIILFNGHTYVHTYINHRYMHYLTRRRGLIVQHVDDVFHMTEMQVRMRIRVRMQGYPLLGVTLG